MKTLNDLLTWFDKTTEGVQWAFQKKQMSALTKNEGLEETRHRAVLTQERCINTWNMAPRSTELRRIQHPTSSTDSIKYK